MEAKAARTGGSELRCVSLASLELYVYPEPQETVCPGLEGRVKQQPHPFYPQRVGASAVEAHAY